MGLSLILNSLHGEANKHGRAQLFSLQLVMYIGVHKAVYRLYTPSLWQGAAKYILGLQNYSCSRLVMLLLSVHQRPAVHLVRLQRHIHGLAGRDDGHVGGLA